MNYDFFSLSLLCAFSEHVSSYFSAELSTMFDIGGMIGEFNSCWTLDVSVALLHFAKF